MSDPFFQKKRKRSNDAGSKHPIQTRRKDADEFEDAGDIGAVEDMNLQHTYDDGDDGAAAADRETPAEAKVRLAKLYLEGLHEKEDIDGIDAAAVDRENIAARLRKDVEEGSGHMHIAVATRICAPKPEDILCVRGHRASMTCARTDASAKHLFTSDKDGRIWQWRLRDGTQVCMMPRGYARESEYVGSAPMSNTSGAARRRERARRSMQSPMPSTSSAPYKGHVTLQPGEGHTSAILSLSVSDDGRFCASAGCDKRIGIWETTTTSTSSPNVPTRWVKALLGHKDAVCSVAFRGGSTELFSASYDRTVKLFDAAQLSYIETLFGHQESIQDLACLRAERAVTAGGRERTCRLWKIREESQLVFRGGTRSKVHALLEGGDLVDTPGAKKNEVHEGSVDCVSMIDDNHFVSGSDSGTLSLWSLAKKKPLFVVYAAHGYDRAHGNTQPLPRYITSVACLPYGDVFASGSWDGVIRLWALDSSLRSFRFLFDVPAPGVVNSLQLLTPSIEHMDDYPVVPSLWRRRGGAQARLDRVAKTNGHHSSEPHKSSSSLSLRSGLHMSADGHVLGHKESIPPLLIAALAPEPRADRWIRIPNAVSAALVIPMWLLT